MNTEPSNTTSSSNGLTRRSFLWTAAGAGAAIALARPARAFGINPSSSQEIRVALVGIGAQGRVLADAMLKIPNVRMVALCDIWDYSRKFGERYLKVNGQTVRGYSDYDEMLSKEKDLDAVVVATPDFMHAPHANAALRAGHHVYCEKMMSNTLEGARSMVKTMKETGKLLQIGHQRRSNPRYIFALNRLIKEANLLDRITAANAQWNRAVGDDLGWPKNAAISQDILQRYGYRDMNTFRNWRCFKQYGGGPLSDLGAHQIDIFTWFFGGPPRTVLAGGGVDYYKNHEWFDNAMVIYEYGPPEQTARAFYEVLTTTSAGGGYFEQFMGLDGTLKMSENPKYTKIHREARARDWSDLVQKHYLNPSAALAAAREEDKSDDGKVDARETADLVAYDIPVVLNKPIHQPHLENFFNAIRGTAKLNCPADEALASEIAVFKASEAVYAKKMINIEPQDYEV